MSTRLGRRRDRSAAVNTNFSDAFLAFDVLF